MKFEASEAGNPVFHVVNSHVNGGTARATPCQAMGQRVQLGIVAHQIKEDYSFSTDSFLLIQVRPCGSGHDFHERLLKKEHDHR